MKISLEKMAAAGKKFVLGTSISLAALTLSPDRAEGQIETICQNEKGENKPVITNDGDYYHVNYWVQGQSRGFYVQDDLVTSYTGDCVSYSLRNARRGSHNGEPAIVVRGSNRAISGSRRSNLSWGESLAAGALSGIIEGGIEAGFDALFNSNDSEGTRETYTGKSVDLESLDRGGAENDEIYSSGPGKWSSSSDSFSTDNNHEDKYASWGSPEEDNEGNVRNVEGKRANKSDDNYATWESEDDNVPYGSGKDEKNDDWIGESAEVVEASKDYAASSLAGNLPYVGKIQDARDFASDMKGSHNPIKNWYDNNLSESNEFFGITKSNYEGSFWDFRTIDSEEIKKDCPRCNTSVWEGRNNLSKIIASEMLD
ncbi:MAG: hypothetical protein ABEJ02_04560 [Candidatus Paceibacteria bacterium]